jgi:hypothetical protein
MFNYSSLPRFDSDISNDFQSETDLEGIHERSLFEDYDLETLSEQTIQYLDNLGISDCTDETKYLNKYEKEKDLNLIQEYMDEEEKNNDLVRVRK